LGSDVIQSKLLRPE